ncbi:SGNH/GDSL hydrolase family protein [Microscilla marina]|uniref:SGNH/GDSL hydrolase family protein n=1 Tax=Microscilla marina TaxID=1027 RepID=UPI0002E582D6|nr:SGNH/GDSL hydrolase family protein [Microscilla marina]
MRKNPIILVLIGLLFIGFTSCKEVTPSPTPTLPTAASAGTADFSKYIAVGNSLTAGLTNGGLYNDGMQYAFPNLLAGQFAQVSGGAFVQPTFGAGKENGSGFLKLTDLKPTIVNETSNLAIIGVGADGKTNLLEKYTGDLNNLGIPGIKVAEITTAGYGFNNAAGFNNYFERLLGTSDATSNYVDFVTAKSSGVTFFSCWMGGNDVLRYAVDGGAAPEFITPTAMFETNYKSLLDKFGSAKGILITIPKLTFAAHFTTVTLVSLQAAVKAGGGPDNADIYITEGTGATVRKATIEDFFLLGKQTNYASLGKTDAGANNGFPYGLHPSNPLGTDLVLDKTEAAACNTAVDAYNAIIKTEADTRGLAYLDINVTLGQAATADGVTLNGITYRTTFIQGGIFSLDGIHLTPAGNAVATNEMIKVINAKYGSTIPELNNTLYSTLILSK